MSDNSEPKYSFESQYPIVNVSLYPTGLHCPKWAISFKVLSQYRKVEMMEQVSRWLQRDPDSTTKAQLQQLIDSNAVDTIKDCFSQRLEFGTAGLRGKVGCGPNRMNRLVIQETATGLGQYLIKILPNAAHRGVVIGYDGRTDSKRFAHDAASILTQQGIKVFLTAEETATPVVAFGIKHLKAAAAIVVTASHNPPEYNGFKVYWENGAQIIPPHDNGIANEIETASTLPISMMPLEAAEEKNLLVWLKKDYFYQYQQAINNQPSITKQSEKHQAVSLSYTAMHGVGAKMAEQLLSDNGFTQVYSVPEQNTPDGKFPTVNFPNPEEPGAMDMVIALAKEHQADLACANDPDADRFAVAARTPDGNYQMLTGDQVGCLLAQYLLSHCDKPNPLVGNTIVSSTLLKKIAESNKADYYQTLTGFKWLTNVAMSKKQDNKTFLFAYEEALGYAIGETVWDKDGLSALLAFAQLASELKGQNKTVWDQLELLYREHGVYLNSQRSIALDPTLPAIGEKLRNNPPSTIAGRKVEMIEDLKTLQRSFSDGKVEMIDLPVSDVLIYHLSDGARVIVRPSGTEPKLKCYYQIVESFDNGEAFDAVLDKASESMSMLISEHQHSLI